jgi:CelD/BcsL family acetyltransferase involved in cellulose biosynthesis
MSITLTPLTFDELKAIWSTYQKSITAPHPFVLPEWLDAWWGSFGGGDELYIRAVVSDGETIGIAPLRIKESIARFIGSPDVCDYLDFIVKPSGEADFFAAVLDGLKASGVKSLELESLRPDSTVVKHLIPWARSQGLIVETEDTDVTLEMPLQGTWDTYLAGLSTHQRHEIGRKGRRLAEAGGIQFDIKPPSDIDADLSVLIRLLRISRADKADFMTEGMETFFKQLSKAIHEAGLLRIGHLSLGGKAVASVMCFDYNGVRYLYNSGYDPEYSLQSVGLVSKVYSIKDAIEQKMIRYDFLKGAEVYKYHLGGREMPISRCRIGLPGV